MSWLTTVRRFAREQKISDRQVRQLEAFGWVGEVDTSTGDEGTFEALEAWSDSFQYLAAEEIGSALKDEVDVAQAKLFGRRVQGVLEFMDALRGRSAWVRILRVALSHRLPEVLDVSHPPADKPPRALRVRAIADYYFSLTAVEYHRLESMTEGREPVSVAHMVNEMEWREVELGLWESTLEGLTEEGPFRASLLRLMCADIVREPVIGVKPAPEVRLWWIRWPRWEPQQRYPVDSFYIRSQISSSLRNGMTPSIYW